jgi:hypothetical protein
MTQEKTKLREAIDCFGIDVVREVKMIVEFSDADGAYSTFQDQGMFEHAECVEMLYFEQ